MDIETTERATYGILDFLGDIGGLIEVLLMICGSLMFYLSGFKLDALMINRLYHVSSA